MKKYLLVWALLLVLTAVEVVLAYLHTPLAIMLALLIGLSLVKAGSIVAWFMHLAEEHRALAWTLMPALFFIALLLLGILPDAVRAGETLSR
ncbi:MAG: cytochrome C oxidase subunit IV family protein [Acidobacteria bacterium]|nr:cytochrome C oxidase subunit IV family protein [Acidobacteriota bacterium]